MTQPTRDWGAVRLGAALIAIFSMAVLIIVSPDDGAAVLAVVALSFLAAIGLCGLYLVVTGLMRKRR